MKILQVNKYHFPKGGADKYYLNLSKKLEENNYQVANFSMHHPDNFSSKWSKYFVSNIEFNNSSLLNKLKSPGRIIYSLEAKNKFEKLVNDFKPNIIHLHNIYHQISPSILHISKKYNIPTIIHLHDYKLVCPNYQLFVNNKTCQACLKKKYYNCLLKKCHKNSYSKSALASLEMYIHHSILNIYQKNIDHLISPSQFLRDKFLEFAWDKNKFSVVYNPFDNQLKEKKELKRKDFLLYFGRLSPEKGIETIINSLEKTNEKLIIVGSGPSENDLKKIAKKKNINVKFLGYKKGDDLLKIILEAKAVLIPSIWWENMPLNMLEALSLGKVVIASNTGGIPEIIKEGINGFLFSPKNSQELKEKINKLNSVNLEEMSISAKRSVSHLNPENNLKNIIDIYLKLLNGNL
jgi:glycosyltransferase involved in cell wall biosynthesis